MKFDNMEAYTTDPGLESGEGVKVTYPNGMSFRLRRAGGENIAYVMAIAQVAKVAPKDIVDAKTRDASDQMMKRVYADTIIAGWEGVTSDGKPVPFTRENVVSLLNSSRDFWFSIIRDANDMNLFLAETKAGGDKEKN